VPAEIILAFLKAAQEGRIENDVRFCLDHTFHHELPGIIPDGNRNAFRVTPRVALQGTCPLPDYADSIHLTFSASRSIKTDIQERHQRRAGMG